MQQSIRYLKTKDGVRIAWAAIGSGPTLVKAANWLMRGRNAPIVFDYSYRLFLQDYPAWMKAGSMDFVSPQVYRADVGSFERELDKQLEHMGGEGSRMAPGVDISNTNAETLVRSIEICRERKLAGVVIWYYGALVQKGALVKLRETVFSEPAALPWR